MVNTNKNSSNNSSSIEVSFRPRARIMRTLGQELISSEAVAIVELVKNSFDADATEVLIRFIGPLEIDKGCIEIIDNGHGMDMGTVQSAWMEPATNSKRTRKRSERLKRRLLGEKGVGRFACSRLTNDLELITRRKNQPAEIYALFDWTQFDNEDIYLDEIEILAEQRIPIEFCSGGGIEALRAKEKKPAIVNVNHGTILRMNGLKKVWAKNDFEDLQRDLSRLISPFVDFSDFSIRLELPDEYSEFSSDISTPKVINYPHYSIVGSVDETGKYDFAIQVYATGFKTKLLGSFLWGGTKDDPELLRLSPEEAKEQVKEMDQDELQTRTIQTGPIDVELRIWDRDELGNVVQETNSTISDVRRDLDAVAGINIYRDGFRVLPYGEPKDDWLRLDIRRVQKPSWRLSNNQIVGFVSISSDKNPNLKDQSNREGLDENRAIKDLRSILISLLNEIEQVRHSLRKRETQRPFAKPVQGLFSALNLTSLQERISTKYPNDKKTLALIQETQKNISEQIDEIQIVISRYQRLATLGTLIDVILHDSRHSLSAVIDQAVLGQEEIDKTKNSGKPLINSLHQRFEKIEEQGDFLNSVFDRIEPFGGRRRGRPEQLYLEKIIESTVAVYKSEIKRLGVKVSLPKSKTLVRVDQAEIQQVILNLLQNSLYWLEYVPKDKRQIAVNVKRVSETNVEILFADSGPGIPNKNKDLIFEPYFSTKPNGVGLGLAIAGEIVSDYYNGKLELVKSDLLDGANFLITLKKRV